MVIPQPVFHCTIVLIAINVSNVALDELVLREHSFVNGARFVYCQLPLTMHLSVPPFSDVGSIRLNIGACDSMSLVIFPLPIVIVLV